MNPNRLRIDDLFRIWILSMDGFTPSEWADIPARGLLLALAEEEVVSAHQARQYVRAFNRQMLLAGTAKWAAAISLRIELGEKLAQGDIVVASQLHAFDVLVEVQ